MKFLHFAWSWLVHTWARARGYHTISSAQTQLVRWNTCINCEFFDDGECRACGCLVLSKTMMALEKCPKKKWKKEWRKRGVARTTI